MDSETGFSFSWLAVRIHPRWQMKYCACCRGVTVKTFTSTRPSCDIGLRKYINIIRGHLRNYGKVVDTRIIELDVYLG